MLPYDKREIKPIIYLFIMHMGFNYQSIVQCYITILNLHRDRDELEQGKTSTNSCQADQEKVRVLKALGTGRNEI